MATSWNLKILAYWHLALVAFIGSFFWAPTKILWDSLDIFFFKLLNGSLEGNPNWQLFWALANHRGADWLEDLFLFTFFTLYVCHLKKGSRLQGVSHCIFTVLYIATIIFFVNRLFFGDYLNLFRESPTRVFFEESFKLSEHIEWLKIKDGSSRSFPGDHATTALLFASLYASFAPKYLKRIFFLYASFLCLPRMVAGAHWLSDVIVGSGSIALFFRSWAVYTPLGAWCCKGLEKILRFRCSLKQKNKELA